MEARIELLAPQELRVSAIEAANDSLTSEIKTLCQISTKLKEDLDSVQSVLVQIVDLESRVEESTQCNKRLIAENTDFKAEISHLKSEISNLKEKFPRFEEAQEQTEKGISFEQQQINSNIIIRGVDLEENTGNDHLLETFNQIRTHLGVSEINDFEAVEIGIIKSKSNSDKDKITLPKTIQVKFRSVDHKRRFLQIRRAKKSVLPSEVGLNQKSKKTILIVEQLTKQNQELLYNARSLRTSSNFKFVWSNNGQILARLRQGSKVIRIENINHVNQLKAQFSPTKATDGSNHSTYDIKSNSGNTQA